ncbi:MAG: EAL domain-containing protein, partial [Campylobacterota bacterium]|nr:EAL domain-containing protein [Campylobacterota bacterium]
DDGRVKYVKEQCKTSFDKDLNPLISVGTVQDITERKEAQKRLEDTNYNLQHYIDAIDKLDIGLFVVNDDFTIRYMNNTMIKWFGDQNGKVCYSAIANLNEPCSYCKLHEVIHENKKVTYEPTTPDGQTFNIIATSIRNADGSTSKMEVIRNITDEKKAHEDLLEQKEKLHHQAHHDALTELPNRILFHDRLEQAIEKSKRKKNNVALLFIDLDHFKEINDSLGHKAGDEVLKVVTKRLKDIIRDEDTLARLGGDEFTVIIENLTQGEDASLLAQKIIKVLSEPIEMYENQFYVSSSIGISLYPEDGHSAQNLLKYADSAMYKAKAEGRNNFQYYSSEMTELAFERVVMEASFRAALEDEDFVVYYQPQIDAKSNSLIGMEALVRWKHQTLGIVSPAKFIPLAESIGLIVPLDRFVMKSAMRQIAKWYEDGLNPGVLALNLAVKQLGQKDFFTMLKSLMKETGCKAEWLEFEVTEGQIMTKPKEAIKVLNKISDMGIELAVDDFGTGYSSLSYLKKLPIDKLKIDQSFVRDLPDDEDDAAISKAVIALAKSLNLKIIAEGVETIEQKEFLIQNGCRNIQGYLYAKPMPSDEMEEFLLKGLPNKML